ncbi:alpha/beta hydrolase [Paenibacillus lutrae]|uniref:Alpha/beta fold hydrolase n=1 Tax=Paenibacillus lutrae TaxID=2078573 RepID=A0A7X3JZR1_9BACL|nr:alpha/beta hydrolase [Paenibacillus lutrae]MVP00292.1 alpha/beta fold hydrolase [Paenibacillus lutrae]
MKQSHFHLDTGAGSSVFVHLWEPEADTLPQGIVQIAHGMAEHAGRYSRFAEQLTAGGYIVYANDHRGHGRTALTEDDLGYPGRDGFNAMTSDIITLAMQARTNHPGLPLFLFAHSMGSFLAQKVLYRAPELYRGVILCGTNGPHGSILKAGSALANLIILRKGERFRGKLLTHLALGSFNIPFRPNRTEFDWLSSDDKEVDKFIEDPLCGYVCTTNFFKEFFSHLGQIHLNKHLKLIPKDLPIYLIAGDKDPVGGQGKGVLALQSIYGKLGLRHVECKLYANKRHELLNEVNRDEVASDIMVWLERTRRGVQPHDQLIDEQVMPQLQE